MRKPISIYPMEPRQDNLTLTDRELLYRLGWFTRMRWVLGGFTLLMLLASWYLLGVRYRTADGEGTMGPAANVVLLIFLYNAAFIFLTHVIRARSGVTRRMIVLLASLQIVCDMVAVCAVAHFSGGIENFFIILILVPLVIATELLPKPLAYAAAAFAVLLIQAMAWGEQQGAMPHVRVILPGAGGAVGGAYLSSLYVLEVTGALTALIFATVFVASSISGRLRAREAELERAYHQLNLADEAKSFFMRKAGHDLRAPLSAIHSILASIVHASDDLPEEHRRLIVRAQVRAKAMISMVDELREYSQLRAPDNVLQTRRVGLDEIVRNTTELFRQQAKSTGVALACSTEPVRAVCDEQLIRELVTNLVSNALQYTPRGGRVDVKVTPDTGSALLVVSDTGMGISEEDRGRLFEEFYRSPEAKRTFPEGTGLGLAICRRIVEMHGGEITVTPNAPQGTIFQASLPLRPHGEVSSAPSPQ
jgi:signal transduction histidine kinase